MGKEIIFDLDGGRLGVVNANCPEYLHRPTHQTTGLDPPTSKQRTSNAPNGTYDAQDPEDMLVLTGTPSFPSLDSRASSWRLSYFALVLVVVVGLAIYCYVRRARRGESTVVEPSDLEHDDVRSL